MLNGKAREMGFGSYPELSLEGAREEARKARGLKGQGIDPIDARESARASQRLQDAKAVTFRHCAESYIAAHKDAWRSSKHAGQWTTTLETYAMPILGDVPVAKIDRALVIRVLEPIWKTRTETASRLRGRIEAVLDWAAGRDYRGGDNPARWKGHLSNLFPARSKVQKPEHHAALPFAELPAFMAKLKGEQGPDALALQFTILTAVRTAEALHAQWSEIDLANAIWTVPGKRTKGGARASRPALQARSGDPARTAQGQWHWICLSRPAAA